MRNKLLQNNRLLIPRNRYFGGGGYAPVQGIDTSQLTGYGNLATPNSIAANPLTSTAISPTQITVPKGPSVWQNFKNNIANSFKNINPVQSLGLDPNSMIAAGGAVIGSALAGGKSSEVGDVLNQVGSPLLGGLYNSIAGVKFNEENIAAVEQNNKNMKNFQSNASDYDNLAQEWMSAPTAMSFGKSYIGKDSWLNHGASKKFNWLSKENEAGASFVNNSLQTSAQRILNTNMRNLESNYNSAAYGGELNTQGGDFTNGIVYIDNGGTHEENPNGGVPMGIDSEGTPNLVEEGEVVFNDYVFSKRLKVPETMRQKYKLKGTKPLTFADAAILLSKESEERPNDSISRRGLVDSMIKLQQAQEQLRTENNINNNRYAHGGIMGRMYDGTGNESNFLQFYTPQERWLRSAQKRGTVPTYNISTPQKPFSIMTPNERVTNLKTKLEIPSLVDNRTPSERWMDESIKAIQPGLPVIDNTNTTSTSSQRDMSWLRYAPAIGAGIGVLTDTLGLTNKPDYSNADLIGDMVNNLHNVQYTPIGNYLTYRPLDKDYYINKLNAEASAARRAITNQSGGNRATAMAGLLAADYNAMSKMGELARQAEEYNAAQREKVETFNRGTNQFNSEMALKADIANQSNNNLRLQARIAQAKLRDQIDARASAGRSANLTNLFDSLGDIGREDFSRNMIQTNPALYYSIDSSGKITYKNGYNDLSEAEKETVRNAATRNKSKRKATGGYLIIKKK